jgi:hypothetical protein
VTRIISDGNWPDYRIQKELPMSSIAWLPGKHISRRSTPRVESIWIALVAIAAALIAGAVFDYFPPSEMMFVGP